MRFDTGSGGHDADAAAQPALHDGHDSGVAFDVGSAETPPSDHPFMALLDRPNFIMTPDVA